MNVDICFIFENRVRYYFSAIISRIAPTGRWVIFTLEMNWRDHMDQANVEKDVLVVVSKLKNYIRSVSGMNTAANVAPRLSDEVRRLCDQAIEHAKADNRKTVMDRDFV